MTIRTLAAALCVLAALSLGSRVSTSTDTGKEAQVSERILLKGGTVYDGTGSEGFDRSRRCYQLQNRTEKPKTIEFAVHGSKDSPIHNPAFYITNWNAEKAEVLVNGEKPEDCEIGIHHKIEGTDLVVFLWVKSDSKVDIKIVPE